MIIIKERESREQDGDFRVMDSRDMNCHHNSLDNFLALGPMVT